MTGRGCREAPARGFHREADRRRRQARADSTPEAAVCWRRVAGEACRQRGREARRPPATAGTGAMGCAAAAHHAKARRQWWRRRSPAGGARQPAPGRLAGTAHRRRGHEDGFHLSRPPVRGADWPPGRASGREAGLHGNERGSLRIERSAGRHAGTRKRPRAMMRPGRSGQDDQRCPEEDRPLDVVVISSAVLLRTTTGRGGAACSQIASMPSGRRGTAGSWLRAPR
jgi:hypothetical protein